MAAENKFGRKAVVFLVKFFAVYAVLQALILTAPLAPLENKLADYGKALDLITTL